MRRTGIVAVILLLVGVFIPWTTASAVTDGFYNLSETTVSWVGTDAGRTKPPTTNYDYTYGDESSITYRLPWAVNFYGTSYNEINVDTNGNIWFGASGPAHSFNLASTGRGPVIAAWNEDLSSYYHGGVFIQHKTYPEQVVVEWQTETYTEEGFSRPNNFEVVIFPNGTIRLDYKNFTAQPGPDFGSGTSRGDGTANLNLTANYDNVRSLAGRSFLFTHGLKITVASTAENFGSIGYGMSAPPHIVTVTNSGTENLIIGSLGVTGANPGMFPLVAGNDGCSGVILLPAQNCTAHITFSPVALGLLTAQLNIPSNDPATPILSVALNGTGDNPLLSVTKAGSGAGLVTGFPTGISCGTTCTGNYPLGTIVTLTAVPDANSVFTGWSGACSGTDVCMVTMDAAKTITAAFASGAAPSVSITSPAGITNNNRPVLQYTADSGTVVVKVDGAIVNKVSGNALDTLADGTHLIRVETTDSGGKTGFAEIPVTIDTVSPVLTISTLADGSYTNNNILNVTGSITDATVGARNLRINNVTVPFGPDGGYSYALTLMSGINLINLVAVDEANNQMSDSRTINLIQPAPNLVITTPADNSKTASALLTISGTVDETATVTIKTGSNVQTAAMNGVNFSADMSLIPGTNTIEIIATDLANNISALKRTVVYDDQKPSLAITQPAQDISTSQAGLTIRGTVSDLYTAVTVHIALDDQVYTPAVVNGQFEQAVTFTTAKSYAIIITATNESGTTTTAQRNVIYNNTGIE